MKPLAPYFGNRRASVTKNNKTRSRKGTEMEALESRLLLSGITAGSKVLKSYNFVDADGDKVSIKLTGKVAKGAGFQVDGLGNGFDVNEINLVGDLSKANLVVSVNPVKLAPSDRTTANQLYTPGYTNIAVITADSQATSNSTATGSTAIRNIALNAAVVGNISLAGADITGAINLGIGKTAFVDRINTASPTTGGAASSYTPSVGFIDLYDVSAKSIGLISVNGTVASKTDTTIPGFVTSTNDLLGSITVSGNVGGITAVRSNLNGTLDVTGNLGKVNVGDLNGTITAGGDITIVLPDGSDASITAGGHINVAWRGNVNVSIAELIAGKGISGISTSTSDVLKLGSNFSGSLVNTGAAYGISDISVTGGALVASFTANSAGSIGNVSATDLSVGVTLTASGGNIGTITTTAGGVDGNITASGNIGAITVDGGELAATVVAGGSIGAIDADNGTATGNAISGSFTAGSLIASITAKSLDGIAITNAAEFTAGTSIGAISATTTDGTAIGTADFNAGTTIAAITAQGSVLAANIDAETGITSITVTDAPLSAGNFAAVVISGGNIGAVNIAGNFSGTVQTDDSLALTGGSIGAVTIGGASTGTLNAKADTATNATIGAILVGEGITAGTIASDGAIASITVSLGGISGATMTGIGSITGALAVTGNISKAITTTVGGIGSITTTADTVNGTDGDISAAIISETSIGSISISGDLTNDITAATTIGAIIITGDLGGVLGDTINAQSGNIASVTVGGDLVGKVDVDNGAIAGVVNVSGALKGIILVENATNANATVGAITIGEGIAASAAHTAIDAEGAVASITVSANGIQAVGAPTVISVGSITGVLSVTGDIVDEIETTVGGIGSITVLADADATPQDGDVSANITSVGNIGVIAIDGELSSTIEATKGDVNNITVGSVSGASIIAGNNGGTADDAGTIGNITITGDGDQSITLNAFSHTVGLVTTGGTIGNVSALALADTKTLAITVGNNALSIGDITVDSPEAGETANLTLVNGFDLATIGDIQVDGNVDLDGGANSTIETIGDVVIGGWLDIGATTLDSVTSLGDFTLNEFNAAAATIGAGIAGDATIGYVSINSSINLAGPMVTFEFETWTRVTGATTLGNVGAFDIGLVDGTTIVTGGGGVSAGGGQIVAPDITLAYV